MRFLCLTSIVLFIASCQSKNFTSLKAPSGLLCEYRTNPPIVDFPNPRLDWINTASTNERGLQQTAYQIRVSSSPELLENPDLWDSHKVTSIESTRIPYAGLPLTSGQVCYWQVRVWDQNDKPTEWSEPAQWRMGLLNPSDWKAQWIGAPWDGEDPLPKPPGPPSATPENYGPPAPLFRKSINVLKEIQSAVAYVTGLGYFEFYVNGEKVGDDVLVPNQTNYGKRPGIETAYINLPDNFRRYKVMYLAYDITKQLNHGANTLGALLGNGFYNPAKFWTEGYGTPRFLGQIEILYTDGTKETIISDTTWRVTQSPILRNMVYYGESYDARKEIPDWGSTTYDDRKWDSAVERQAPYGDLVAHTAYPDKVTEQLKPIHIEKLEDGHYEIDFGVEISGWVKLINIDGPEGHAVDISFDANLYSGDNQYICNGKGPTTYSPRFNWFVFRSVEIKNWPGELTEENIVAEAVNTYIPPAAQFETSNPLFNQINQIWQRSQLDNMHGGIASDCPHRERSGYTGDGQVACPTVMHNFDARNFYHKWVADMYEAQNPDDGYVPNGAPWQPGCGGGVAWGAAICIIPWEYYLAYGDLGMLKDHYDGMTGYIRYMQTWVDSTGIMFSQRRNASGEILKWFNLGEWVSPGKPIPDDMVHTFYFWYCVDITARVASILGNPNDKEKYAKLAARTKGAFHKNFYNTATGSYGAGGGNILALKMGVPEDQYQNVTSALQADVRTNDGHLDTGIFGTRFFFEVLAKNGMQDLAYAAMNKTTEPGFGRWIELGSTTTREQWDEDGSHNHPMFGGGLIWFYRNLAGLEPTAEHAGYRKILFHPQPVDELENLSYTYQTPYGEAQISWTQVGQELKLNITVPVSCSAEVRIPKKQDQVIKESGRLANESSHVQFLREEEACAYYEIVSGSYQFTVGH